MERIQNWKRVLIAGDCSLREAMELLNRFAELVQTGLVVEENCKLIGTLSGGDIRRALIAGCCLEDSVLEAMNPKPITVSADTLPASINRLMKTRKLPIIPVVDQGGIVKDVYYLDEFEGYKKRDNQVVVMAGGLGLRMRPLTNSCPKPLLKVGSKPILQRIVESFSEQGFHYITFSINHLGAQIKDYFGDGSNWNVSIDYLEETTFLGTAGSLRLLPIKSSLPIILTNGDLLTKIDYQSVIDWHSEHGSLATMCVSLLRFEVPYGVVESEDYRIVSLTEKPSQSLWVNAGVYVIEPSILGEIPKEEKYDITTLFNHLIKSGKPVYSYPINDYWLDVGSYKDLEKARVQVFEILD